MIFKISHIDMLKIPILILLVRQLRTKPTRSFAGVTALCLLAGCSGTPPKPPQVQGEYRPINRVAPPVPVSKKPTTPRNFDFSFEGDIVASLNALHAIQPQLLVTPPLGAVSPLPVRLNLHQVTMEEAMRAIGAQGGDVAEVVFGTTGHPDGDQAFIRFRAPTQQANQPVALAPAAKPN